MVVKRYYVLGAKSVLVALNSWDLFPTHYESNSLEVVQVVSQLPLNKTMFEQLKRLHILYIEIKGRHSESNHM
jgi:hypothetical protein